MRKFVVYAVVIVLMMTLITMPLTVPLFKSSTPYSMFNTGWDGTARFAMLLHSKGINLMPLFQSFDMENLKDKNGVLIIIAPDLSYTSSELAQIRDFVKRGNTLLIADDFGYGDDILKALNLPVRISKYPLRDFFYEKDDRLIVAVRISDPVLGRNVSRIIMNEPSAITVSRKGEVYASKVAMVNFHMREFPILAEVPYGDGKVIVLSDPDILTNQLFTENQQFLENLVSYIGAGTAYMDEAHHRDFNLYSSGTVTITRILPVDRARKILVITGIIILLLELGALGYLLKPVSLLLDRFFGEKKEDLITLAVQISKRNGWDEREVLAMIERMGG
ncbi:DUF4350 domain-containing protein [Thermococcus sp.]